MKIASWNVNSLKVRLPHLMDWLDSAQPDVVALQEIKMVDDDFPHEAIEGAGYRALVSGQKTYNGVALLTRTKAADPIYDIPGFDDPQRRVLAATVGDIRVIDLYVVNGQEVTAGFTAPKGTAVDLVYIPDEPEPTTTTAAP